MLTKKIFRRNIICAYAQNNEVKKMPRQKKCRKVSFVPDNDYFYPVQDNKEEVVMIVEELEAIRLSDLEGLEQGAAAEKMNVSRGTFQRIIKSARVKVADALVNGKGIKITGGHYEIACGNNKRKELCEKCKGCRFKKGTCSKSL